MKKVAVVILNWNGEKLLKKFLPSVVQTIPEYAEVIIADNASTDSSIHFLNSSYPGIKIIQNTTNGGFAKGYNDALKHIHNEYLVKSKLGFFSVFYLVLLGPIFNLDAIS